MIHFHSEDSGRSMIFLCISLLGRIHPPREVCEWVIRMNIQTLSHQAPVSRLAVNLKSVGTIWPLIAMTEAYLCESVKCGTFVIYPSLWILVNCFARMLPARPPLPGAVVLRPCNTRMVGMAILKDGGSQTCGCQKFTSSGCAIQHFFCS